MSEPGELSVEAPEGPLLSAALQARLRALEVQIRRPLPSNMRGDRRAPQKKGISLEFADFRSYVPGDDVRHLDWSSYARQDQLIVKLYHDEEDVQLHLVLDDSHSMHFGKPLKARFARQVAAALAWIGLAHSQRVSLTVLGSKLSVSPLRGGAANMTRILEHLMQPPATGSAPLHESCKEFFTRQRPRGAVVLISDLLDPEGVEATLRSLQTRSTELTVIQILAPEEIDPELEGDLRFLDSENGSKVEVHLTPVLLQAYRQRVKKFIGHCGEAARKHGAAFAFSSSGDEVSEFLLRSLVQQGVLR